MLLCLLYLLIYCTGAGGREEHACHPTLLYLNLLAAYAAALLTLLAALLEQVDVMIMLATTEIQYGAMRMQYVAMRMLTYARYSTWRCVC
jgi:hypothetical protein